MTKLWKLHSWPQSPPNNDSMPRMTCLIVGYLAQCTYIFSFFSQARWKSLSRNWQKDLKEKKAGLSLSISFTESCEGLSITKYWGLLNNSFHLYHCFLSWDQIWSHPTFLSPFNLKPNTTSLQPDLMRNKDNTYFEPENNAKQDLCGWTKRSFALFLKTFRFDSCFSVVEDLTKDFMNLRQVVSCWSLFTGFISFLFVFNILLIFNL